MSFGLPLRDRILKWQLVSRVDSVSPVRGKKQQNQRTNISNIFEYSDERVGMAVPERRVSPSSSQGSSASSWLSRETGPAHPVVFSEHLRGAQGSPDHLYKQDFILLFFFFFFNKLKIIFEVETEGDFVFF